MATTTTTTFAVPDLSCERCETAVHGALADVSGVSEIAVDLPGKSVTVKHAAAIDADILATAITSAGYDVGGYGEVA